MMFNLYVYESAYKLENILFLCVISLAVKLIFLLLLFGKPVRNLKFIVGSGLTFLSSSLFFIFISYISTNLIPWLIFTLYYASPYIYLLFIALLYIGCSVLIEFTIYFLVILKGRISRSDLIATLLLINLFGYLFSFEFGFITPFFGL